MNQQRQGLLVLGLLLGLVFAVVFDWIRGQEQTLFSQGTPAPLGQEDVP
jgi:hypothetical protein